MAFKKQVESRLVELAREMVAEEELLCASGSGGQSLFEALEDAAVKIGDAVTREVLRQKLAAQPQADGHCPQCGEAGLRKKERQRSIQTRRGPVDVTEVECYCRRCRRSFFPSV
jgi:hypothetical protein